MRDTEEDKPAYFSFCRKIKPDSSGPGEEEAELFFQGWQQPEGGENSKAAICLVHGLGEHSGRYDHVADFFLEHDISLLGFDLYGHGRSAGKRGTAPSYQFMLSTLQLLVYTAAEKFPGLPLYLYGHSLGGNLALNYALRNNCEKLRGLILTSPWLKLVQKPARPVQMLAGLIYKVYPDLTLSSGLKAEDLSQSGDTRQKYKEDELVHDRISLRLYLESARAGRRALENPDELDGLNLPVLILHGEDDKITDPAASRSLADGLNEAGKHCEYQEYEGLLHELHNSRQREQVLQQITEFIHRNR